MVYSRRIFHHYGGQAVLGAFALQLAGALGAAVWMNKPGVIFLALRHPPGTPHSFFQSFREKRAVGLLTGFNFGS